MRYLALLFLAFGLIPVWGQQTKKVLFIGNSYTNTNNLPELVKNLANSDGNTLIKDASFPGGHFLKQHVENPVTLEKLASDSWDMVVIQEQSQNPSFPWEYVETNVFPYAKILIDSAKSNNECVTPIFYNTWGRRDGDHQWDSIRTFEKMNARLHTAYAYMARANKGLLSPVGIGFQHVKQEEEGIISFEELYVADGSHPSLLGSYLAACIFNNVIFSSTSSGNAYVPSGINSEQAEYLQNVADHVVYFVDSVRIDYRPLSNNLFGVTIEDNKVTMSPYIEVGTFEYWDFGDGTISNEEHATHTYVEVGEYEIQMVTSDGCYNDVITEEVLISTLGLNEFLKLEEKNFKVYPNPSLDGKVRIEHNGDLYSVYTLLGEEVFTGKSNAIQLNKGIYFFKQGEDTQKVLVY